MLTCGFPCPRSRLGCQVILDEDLDGIVVTLPAETANMLG